MRGVHHTQPLIIFADNPTEDADFQMESFQQEVALMADLSRYDNFVKVSLTMQCFLMITNSQTFTYY